MTVGSVLKFWPLAALAGVAVLGECYLAAARDAGARQEQIKQDKKVIAAYRSAIIELGSHLPKTDTAAARSKTVYLAAKVDYKHIADSITAALKAIGEEPPPVITACNVAIAAADTALGGCAHQVALRDSLLAKHDSVETFQDSLIAHLGRRAPFLIRIGRPLLPFAIGVGTGLLIKAGGRK